MNRENIKTQITTHESCIRDLKQQLALRPGNMAKLLDGSIVRVYADDAGLTYAVLPGPNGPGMRLPLPDTAVYYGESLRIRRRSAKLYLLVDDRVISITRPEIERLMCAIVRGVNEVVSDDVDYIAGNLHVHGQERVRLDRGQALRSYSQMLAW